MHELWKIANERVSLAIFYNKCIVKIVQANQPCSNLFIIYCTSRDEYLKVIKDSQRITRKRNIEVWKQIFNNLFLHYLACSSHFICNYLSKSIASVFVAKLSGGGGGGIIEMNKIYFRATPNSKVGAMHACFYKIWEQNAYTSFPRQWLKP